MEKLYKTELFPIQSEHLMRLMLIFVSLCPEPLSELYVFLFFLFFFVFASHTVQTKVYCTLCTASLTLKVNRTQGTMIAVCLLEPSLID